MSTPLLARTLPRSAAPTDGVWVLYAGGEVILTVPGLNLDGNGVPQNARLVFDLATLTSPASVPALNDHCGWDRVGLWTPTITPTAITAGLTLVKPADEIEAEAMPAQVALNAQIRTGVPIQCSVSVCPSPQGQWERIAPGVSVQVNGQTFTGDGALPLFVLRYGQLEEASLVTFGADDATGRAAASRPKDRPMSLSHDRLKALASKYPETRHSKLLALCAAGADDAQIESEMTAADKADAIARCEAAEAEVATLKQQVADLMAQVEALKQQLAAQTAPPAVTATAQASRGTRPLPHGTAGPQGNPASAGEVKTLADGMRALVAEGSKLTGSALRAEARRRFPTAANAGIPAVA